MSLWEHPPGSKEALEQGCTCAVMDNGYGSGFMGGMKDRNGETLYVISGDCPLHAPGEVMR